MLYIVRYFDASATCVREERLEAASRRLVELAIQERGGVLLSAKVARRPVRSSGGLALDVGWWCRELRTLLVAGMTVVEALETLHAQTRSGQRQEVQALLVRLLREGRSLSVAMETTLAFPGVLIAGVRASERTSGLVPALDEYLRYHETLERLRKQLVSAAIYPALVVALGTLITLFLLLFVIPRFSSMYVDLQGPVSLATRALIILSQGLQDYAPAVLVTVAAIVVALFAAWRTGALTAGIVRLAAMIEPLQHRIDPFRLAKLYHALALMLRGGYALDAALLQCARLELGTRLSRGVCYAHQALGRGERVSLAFASAGLADSVTQRLLAVGERSGQFDGALQTIAERHGNDFTLFIERATRIVEPLLMLLVALIVGGIVVLMYMPVFDIAASVR